MYLKSLEIQGFKSFPEKTVIEFHSGITSIVGPNGSGKSNITDAIRWVLGETSVRSLRGAKMEDVIFTGTQTRRAMGFAEVTIVIDNSDARLPVDYTELQVTRRLYRSGESEYLINKVTCRLKDIIMLFMDTGLGRDGYSIVGQGRVDEILSSKSEDRRRVFEEASGIMKFKTRKDEAERKLQSTEANLLRINDILLELDGRIVPLANAAETAKRYLQLRDDLKGTEVGLFLENIDGFLKRIDETNEEASTVKHDLDDEIGGLEEMKARHKESSERQRELEGLLDGERIHQASVQASLSEMEGRIVLDGERIRQIEDRARRGEDEEKDTAAAIERLKVELSAKKVKESQLLAQLQVYNGRLTTYESEMASILANLDASDRYQEELRQRVETLQENHFEKRSQAQQTRNQTTLVDQRRKSIAAEITSLISDSDRLSLQREEAQALVDSANTTLNKRNAILVQERTSLENLKKDCTQTAMNLETRKLDAANRSYRIRTLQELEKTHEGYSEAVKSILRNAEQDHGFGEGIRGTLGDLLRVPQEFETAIEIALGPAVQHIVTDTEGTAGRLIAYLKEGRTGRATFLPISSISSRSLERDHVQKLKGRKGYVGIASELVEAPADVRPIVENLLGRTVVATDFDTAVSFARSCGYAFRIVTLEGDVVGTGGPITGGFSRQAVTGLLGRTREIESLKAEVVAIEEEISLLSMKLPEKESALAESARRIAAMEHEATDLSHERIREESRVARIDYDIERDALRMSMLKAEEEQLAGTRDSILQEADGLDIESENLSKEIVSIRETLGATEIENRQEQEKRDELRETVSALRISVGSLEESLLSAREMSTRIEGEKNAYETTIQKRFEERSTGLVEAKRLAEVVRALEEELLGLKETMATVADRIRALLAEKETQDLAEADYTDRLEAATGRISLLQNDLGRIEMKRLRFETSLDDVRNRLWEEYELTGETAAPWRREIPSVASAQRLSTELRQKMRDLGTVNVAAIEEYDQVNERLIFMKTQRDDIEESRGKLRKVIGEITEEMKTLFVEHFRTINTNFNLVFSELFGGGMAEIALEDENNVLECGIEIKAQPPGKKLQNMMLLSGGERCLTAIALLFAILKLRPTPFCVLDEIEAALDDSNVFRFTEYIHRYSNDSQFILVTHRKGTMEASDRLYGVTMQERGVSRVLSMHLGD
jgi:chromosome segregation protein